MASAVRFWLRGRLQPLAGLIEVVAIPVWPEQYVSALKGWPELIELRIVSAGNQYRPIGFYGPGRHEFALVLGATEKG